MFNARKEKDKIIKFIRDYFTKNNLGGVVIGISGGKDSGVVAGLFTEALGKENVLGVTLPCHSNSNDRTDAEKVSNYFGFELINIDLTKTFDVFKEEINLLGDYTLEEVKNSDINIKPRLRMTTLYYLAALYSELKHKTYIVAGTSNKCEIYVGYYTKGGDSTSDINVVADLTVDEVIKIGEELQVPRDVLYKTPSDGISGLSDEDKLGVKYEDITKYLNNQEIDKEIAHKIEKLHERNLHKLTIPTYKK